MRVAPAVLICLAACALAGCDPSPADPVASARSACAKEYPPAQVDQCIVTAMVDKVDADQLARRKRIEGAVR